MAELEPTLGGLEPRLGGLEPRLRDLDDTTDAPGRRGALPRRRRRDARRPERDSRRPEREGGRSERDSGRPEREGGRPERDSTRPEREGGRHGRDGHRVRAFPLGASPGRGLVLLFLSVIVLLPLAAVVSESFSDGASGFWSSVTNPESLAALKLTVLASLIVIAVNGVLGTLVAWVLVRDEFPGKAIVNALIDLPFALPTIVAGITLIALYGKGSPVGIDLTFSRAAVVLALLFVTLPFVVRAVQPLLLSMDRDAEQAAASLGARGPTIFRRVVLPNLLPGIGTGIVLAFARALGEFGSLILISGNLPFKTLVSSVFIYQEIEGGNTAGAAAVSVILLGASLLLLASIGGLQRWAGSRR